MFQDNVWVYYIAMLLCGAGALIMNAGNVEYSLIDATTGKRSRRNAQVYLITFVLVGYIVFWAAVRNGIIDTPEYIDGYTRIDASRSLKSFFLDDTEKAALFKVYQVVLRRMGLNWKQYLASIAIISGFFVFYGISKYSDDVPFSVYLFMAGLHFYWLFNGVRQFLVVCIFFACLRWVVEKKLFRIIILVVFLCFLHSTAWIIIPIYFIANMKNWSYGIYACILATMAVVILFPNQFTALLDDSFEDYNIAEQFAKDDGVNILRFLVSIVTPALAFVYREQLAEYENPYINVMINMSLITGGLYAVGVVTSGIYIGRLPIYTDLFSLLLLPFIIRRVLPKNLRGPIGITAILFYLLYFFLQSKDGAMYYTTYLFDSMDLTGGFRV